MPDLNRGELRRFAMILGALQDAEAAGDVVTSEWLAAQMATNATQIRRDLSLLGGVGKRGTGYRRDFLRSVLLRRLRAHERDVDAASRAASRQADHLRAGLYALRVSRAEA